MQIHPKDQLPEATKNFQHESVSPEEMVDYAMLIPSYTHHYGIWFSVTLVPLSLISTAGLPVLQK